MSITWRIPRGKLKKQPLIEIVDKVVRFTSKAEEMEATKQRLHNQPAGSIAFSANKKIAFLKTSSGKVKVIPTKTTLQRITKLANVEMRKAFVER